MHQKRSTYLNITHSQRSAAQWLQNLGLVVICTFIVLISVITCNGVMPEAMVVGRHPSSWQGVGQCIYAFHWWSTWLHACTLCSVTIDDPPPAVSASASPCLVMAYVIHTPSQQLESYIIHTPADIGQHLDSYIFHTSANTSWANDLWCIQQTIWHSVVW